MQAKVYFYRTPKRGAAMNASVSDPAFWSRVQFGFTLIYHYLFPQLTMGLA